MGTAATDATADRVPRDGEATPGRAATARASSDGVPAAWIVGAIAVLVVLVSLPRFRAHVLRANREDARLALMLLSARVFAPEWLAAQPADAPPGDLYEVIQRDERLHHRFPDARRPEGQHELLHHGYLFDTGHVVVDGVRVPALVAWPSVFGQSGDVAYARTGAGLVVAHGNAGLWSGTASPLVDADLADEGWRRVEGPPAR